PAPGVDARRPPPEVGRAGGAGPGLDGDGDDRLHLHRRLDRLALLVLVPVAGGDRIPLVVERRLVGESRDASQVAAPEHEAVADVDAGEARAGGVDGEGGPRVPGGVDPRHRPPVALSPGVVALTEAVEVDGVTAEEDL